MTYAHDLLSLNSSDTAQAIALLNIKRALRVIGDDNITLQFSDGSRLIYQRHKSWRFDKFIVDNGEADEI